MRDKKNNEHSFRDYNNSNSKVKNTYQHGQENQNLFFVQSMKKIYASRNGFTNAQGNKIRKRLMDVFAELDKVIDESDPDTDLPQIFHAYQTGEALKNFCKSNNPSEIREDILIKDLFSPDEWNTLPSYYQQRFSTHLHQLYLAIKDWSWLPLVGFLHDLGKVLATKEWGALPQWAVVGDTFPVGAPFAAANVYAEDGFYQKNPDLNLKDNQLATFGIYPRHCGFEKLQMSWSHDEYCYSVLSQTVHHLPEEALYIIRFHSFYPWHTPRQGERGYAALANDKDWMMLPLLKVFQQSDLYSKKAELPNIDQLKQYYLALIERFVPGRASSHYHLRPAQIRW